MHAVPVSWEQRKYSYSQKDLTALMHGSETL